MVTAQVTFTLHGGVGGGARTSHTAHTSLLVQSKRRHGTDCAHFAAPHPGTEATRTGRRTIHRTWAGHSAPHTCSAHTAVTMSRAHAMQAQAGDHAPAAVPRCLCAIIAHLASGVRGTGRVQTRVGCTTIGDVHSRAESLCRDGQALAPRLTPPGRNQPRCMSQVSHWGQTHPPRHAAPHPQVASATQPHSVS